MRVPGRPQSILGLRRAEGLGAEAALLDRRRPPWRTYWAGVASVEVRVGPDAIVVALKRQP
jgi:hypothetical protein